MTVNELLQRLVELAQRGRGTWTIKWNRYDVQTGKVDECGIETIYCEDESKEVVVE